MLLRRGTDPGAGIAGDAEVDHAALRWVLFRQVVPGIAYADFCAQPAIREWYESHLGGDVHPHQRKIIRHLRPGERGIGTATQAHYDLLYQQEGTDQVYSPWIPLGDCPPYRGGLVYLEGSHHWVTTEEHSGTVRRPAVSITADLPWLANQHDARWLVVDYAAGDMVVHSPPRTWSTRRWTTAILTASSGSPPTSGTNPPASRSTGAGKHHWHNRDGL